MVEGAVGARGEDLVARAERVHARGVAASSVTVAFDGKQGSAVAGGGDADTVWSPQENFMALVTPPAHATPKRSRKSGRWARSSRGLCGSTGPA